VFLAIVVTTDAADRCLQHNLSGETIERQQQTNVDGNAATLSILTLRSGEPSMVLNTARGGFCYQFTFIALSTRVRDANEPNFLTLLGAFRFGSGPQ